MAQSLRVQISEITQSLRLCEITKAAHNCMEVLLLQRANNMQNAISQLFLSCIKELQLNYSNPKPYKSSTSLVVSSLYMYVSQTAELKSKV